MTDISERDTDRPPRRGYGYIPDPERSVIHGTAAALMRVARATTPGCLSRLSSSVLDQSSAASCVANAMEAAFRDRMLTQRTLGARLGARLQTYLNARLYGLAQDQGLSVQEVVERLATGALHLDDGGCMIADAVQARFDLGVAPESAVPYSDALVLSATLQPEAYQQAHDQRGKGTAHRCADTHDQRERDIRGAIDADFPVVFGTQVDRAFEDGPPGLWDFHGPRLGGHALEIVAYSDVGVWVRNSWAEDWGIKPPDLAWSWIDDAGFPAQPPTGGFAHVAWETILSPQTNDVYAIQWAVNFSSEVPSVLPHRVPAHLRHVQHRRGRVQPREAPAPGRWRGRASGVRSRRRARVRLARSHPGGRAVRGVARGGAGVVRVHGVRRLGGRLPERRGVSMMAEGPASTTVAPTTNVAPPPRFLNRQERRAAAARAQRSARRPR